MNFYCEMCRIVTKHRLHPCLAVDSDVLLECLTCGCSYFIPVVFINEFRRITNGRKEI